MTASGAVTWSSGAVSLDGSTGSLYTATPVVDGAKSFTVSAWARRTAGGNSDFCKDAVSQDANQTSIFWLGTCGSAWEFGRPTSDVVNAGSQAVQASMTLDVWTHLVGVYDGTIGMIYLYKDGVLQGANAASFAATSPANGSMRIGLGKYNNGPYGYFPGSVDNVQVYERPLESGEVSVLFNAGRAGGAVNMNPAVVRTATPTLKVQVSDADTGSQLWTEFEVRTTPSENGTVVTSSGAIGPNGSPTTVSWPVTVGNLVNGTTYYWRARAFDEIGWYGAWAPFQAVKVDTSPPTLSSPPVSSTQYPQSAWGAIAGTQGNFALSASSTDTVDFEWWVDNAAVHTTTAATGTGPRTAAVTYTPATPMKHILHVKARDLAGWEASYDYEFWVSSSPNVYAHWALDESAGTPTAADTGNATSYGGSLSPATRFFDVDFGPGWVKNGGGQTTNGLVFTGNGVVKPDGPVVDTTKAFTVMAWVNPSDLTVDRTVLSGDGEVSSRWQLGYRKSANGGSGGWCFSMRASDGATPVDACTDGSSLGYPATGTWTHVAAVYDPALTGQQMRVYVMGDPQSCFDPIPETASAAMTGSWSAVGSFVIGRAKSSGVTSGYWRGSVDDVWAHQVALDGHEICMHAQPNGE